MPFEKLCSAMAPAEENFSLFRSYFFSAHFTLPLFNEAKQHFGRKSPALALLFWTGDTPVDPSLPHM